MRYYKIVYTYFNRGIDDEQEMLIRKPSLSDALAYVRQMAHIDCMEDFAIRKIYVEADDKTDWVEVADWADIEFQHQKKM